MTVFLTAWAVLAVECRGEIIDIDGRVNLVAAPASLSEGRLELPDRMAAVFVERQNVVLPEDVFVNLTSTGMVLGSGHFSNAWIPAGTTVDSYLLHFDPIGQPQADVTTWGSLSFDNQVLGIVLTSPALDLSDAILGHPHTAYPTGVFGRSFDWGLEDVVELSHDRKTVTALMRARPGYDHIRIITAVPEPSTLILLTAALGALGLIVYRRRSSC